MVAAGSTGDHFTSGEACMELQVEPRLIRQPGHLLTLTHRKQGRGHVVTG